MQMRRTQVQDSRSPERKSNENVQRKAFKRTRENFNLTKDFRNGLQKMNIKNQIMLNNTFKQIESIKCADFTRFNAVNEYNTSLKVEDEQLDERIKEIFENDTDLFLHNDDDFKINEKQKVAKLKPIPTQPKLKREEVTNEIENLSDEFDQVLRIDCKIIKHTENDDETITNEINTTCAITELGDLDSPVIKVTTLSDSNEKYFKDLQALLIMMSIAPTNSEHKITEITDENPNNEEIIDITSKPAEISVPGHVELQTDDTNDISQILNIAAIRVEINDKYKCLIKKYVEKWRDFVDKKKEFLNKQRQVTLDTFFDKLEKKKIEMNQPPEYHNKVKLFARDYNKYQHRYHVQKHIIALQKAKLEEQNRLIEQLKCNRIIDASKHSVDALKEEVRKTYYEMDKQLKPKLKCLTQELKIPDIEEPALVLHCLKVPQFLQRMEKRAREREEKHAMIRERRKQIEEERLRQKQQAELAKAEMDKEEKQKRIKELRQKRRREKIEGIRKKQHAERMRALTVMADLHYEKTLMSKYGIRPFRLLMELKRDNIERSNEHYKFQLKKNVFYGWLWHSEDMIYEREFKAQDFHRKKILRKAFDALKKVHHQFVLKKQVADDYYDFYVTYYVFRRFRMAIDVIRQENEAKWEKAVLYDNSNILFKTFTCWRSLPALNALKREQEARKARWREKVLQVVPDYSPPDD